MWLQRVGHDWETELNWDRWCNRNFFHCYWLILLTEAQNMSESWLNALGEKYNFAFWKKVVLWYNWCIINCSCVCVCVCVCVYCVLSRVWLFVTPWTVAHQASLSMGFPKQDYWSGLPFPSPDLPNQGSNPCLLHCRKSLYHWATWEAASNCENLNFKKNGG